jgi:hypothetical protein
MALSPLALAAPVDTTTTTDDASAPAADTGDAAPAGFAPNASANRYGIPVCESPMYEALCLADNAKAYCGSAGFQNEFMASCKGKCWCAP